MSKTIRIIFPQWQGGAQPYYNFGARLLAYVAPVNDQPTFEIDVNSDFDKTLSEEDGIIEKKELVKQHRLTEILLDREKPDKIIIFGGDCSISQAPFDYLSQKYKKELGIIWLDAHPDISTISESNHNHEIVLANIMGKGEGTFKSMMGAPVEPERIAYAGIVENPEPKLKRLEDGLKIKTFSPEVVRNRIEEITDWIEQNGIKKIAVHFDLDVLSPSYFKSLTSSKPHQTLEEYGAAVGELELENILTLFNQLETSTEVVGLSVAEFVPWDLINLKDAFSKMKIFN